MSGNDTIAPSGKFWSAMPSESANASAALTTPPAVIPANTTPTAIPSGILWSVTARVSIVVRLSFACGPSVCSEALCRCGTVLSISKRNAMPAKKPSDAKNGEPSDWFMAGRSSENTDALIIMPLAKPESALSVVAEIVFFRKKTHAAPAVVPKNGMSSPSVMILISSIIRLYAQSAVLRNFSAIFYQ